MYNALHILYFFFVLSHFILKVQNVNWLSRSHFNFKKNRKECPLNSIWKDIKQGESISSGKLLASCKFVVVSENMIKFQDLRRNPHMIDRKSLYKFGGK